MTTIQLGDRETAETFQAGDWVAIERHAKAALVGQVARVRSITGSGLLVVGLPGKLEGELVSPRAVQRHDGEPPAIDRVPLADELPAMVATEPQGLDDATWRQICDGAAPAVAQVMGRRTPPVARPPEVELLAEDPVLLDQEPVATATTPPDPAWDAELARLEQRPPLEPRADLPKRRGRPPMSEEHKRAIQQGKQRARDAREAAQRDEQGAGDEVPAGLKLAAEAAQRRADALTARAEPERLAREAAQRMHDEAVTAPDPPAVVVNDPPTRLPLVVPNAGASMTLALDGPFDLTDGARRLLMDALAAREPVVRLNPLIDWLQQLEGEA